MRLHIDKLVYGGDGLGRDEGGQAVFAPYVLPSEVVEVSAPEMREGAAKAQLLQVLSPSAHRVDPACRHFGRCGGCQYQHGEYEAQLGVKVDILTETLERAGLRNRPEIEVHAAQPWGYRNRIRLRVETVEGAIRFGYNLRETREFLPIVECPIAAPVLWRAASAFEKLTESDALCALWLRTAAEIEWFTTADERSVQMLLTLRSERSAGFTEMCVRLQAAMPELAGGGAVLQEGLRSVRGGDDVCWGAGGLRYGTEQGAYWVSRGGFFQVNRFLLDELVSVVTRGRRGALAWDLFAGVGLFARVLTKSFGGVVAVEANARAMRDLAAAKEPKLTGIAAPVVEFLRSAVIGRERPELVVLDPPRAGAGAEVCGLLARMDVPEVVYVSCDPTTLARDLRGMVDSGYDLAELHLVDLFPQTYHLETVAVMRRKTR